MKCRPVWSGPCIAIPRCGRLAVSYALVVFACLVSLPANARARPPQEPSEAVNLSQLARQLEQLQQEVARLQKQVQDQQESLRLMREALTLMQARAGQEARLQDLLSRVEKLTPAVETPPTAAPGAPSGQEELEELRKELAQLPEEKPTQAPQKAAPQASASGAFNLNQLNPEISVTGDIIGFRDFATDGDTPDETLDQFQVREIEFSFVSMLDPYSRMKAFLSYEDGAIHLEEAFAEYLALPGGLRVAVGRQYQQVGMLNRWHQHAYPQIDRPPALAEFLGEESLAQTGIHMAWLLPHWFTSSGELVGELLIGDGEPFAGSRLTHPAWSLYLNNYIDITEDTFFEFGGSVAGGLWSADPDLQNLVFNVFFRLNWTPAGRAKYRGLDLWGEFFLNRREQVRFTAGPGGELLPDNTGWSSRWGGFVYFEYRLNRRWIAGIRGDYVQRWVEPTIREWWLTPYLTLWQSEWVRLRAQYTLMHRSVDGTAHRIMVQLTWAAGPHKHEAY